jgi:hypothetical protein
MTAPATPPGLDPAAIVALAEELPGVARKLAQLIDDAVEQRTRLGRTMLADWRGGARGDFDANEAAHAARAAAVIAHLRRLAADVVDAAAAARRDLAARPPTV